MSRRYKKYSYNQGAKIKKIILCVIIAILVVSAAVVAFMLLDTNNDTNGETTFTIQSPPEKTTYYVGENPSWYGMKLMIVTGDGNTVTFGPESCTITGFDSSKPAQNQIITVSYKNYSATFTISILDDVPGDFQPSGLFKSMTLKSMPKTQYKVNDWLSVKGGILLLEYDDGTTKEIELTYDMIDNFTTEKPGTYTVTVMYMEDGHRTTVTYDITVTE